jgi:hypothetical protein
MRERSHAKATVKAWRSITIVLPCIGLGIHDRDLGP